MPRVDLSHPELAEEKIEEILKKEPAKADIRNTIDFNDDKLVKQLYNLVDILTGKVKWFEEIQILNKQEEKEKFLSSYENGELYEPTFEFKEYRYDPETFRLLLKEGVKAAERLREEDIEEYGPEVLDAEFFSELFTGLFEEYTYLVDLAADIDDRESWLENSDNLWPMIPEELVSEAEDMIDELEPEAEEKDVSPGQVATMWREELERLGIDWDVKVEDVAGCHSAPEREEVVVARGTDGNRMYGRKEARRLTMHEIFHVARGFNGDRASAESGFPPLLRLGVPYYDKTEEGGAIYREKKTGVLNTGKERDYIIKLVAAHRLSGGKNLSETADELVGYGIKPGYAFDIVAKNRRALRHHIYYGGYLEEWRDRGEYGPLLLGKVTPVIGEYIDDEVDANGMFSRPPVGEEKLFDYSYG